MTNEVPNVETLSRQTPDSTDSYTEFLRVASMSAGVYVLPAGALDRQSPHREDEVYYVVRGRAKFRRGEEEMPVQAGDVLFVKAEEPHRFHTISEELVLLVVFAPAETASA
jgi:mannose-6-phosphate isomerase-like protein (cupin superfamily)